MIQDLGDKKLYNEFEEIEAEECDNVFCFDGDKILVSKSADGTLIVPKAVDFAGHKMQYLFRINEERYFLTLEKAEPQAGYEWESTRNLRKFQWKELAFAAATAYHLYQWYRDNQFCGRCGKKLEHDHAERMMRCKTCGNMIFPKIAPAVIVGVINGNKILLTKYYGRVYKKYALIAGFTEIGETAEETVAREVMEEVGLKVKNIRYYKSQPWGTDSNLLLGFFCDLDGDDTITMDEKELSTAEWFEREEMPVDDDGFSLTREMMSVFKRGVIK